MKNRILIFSSLVIFLLAGISCLDNKSTSSKDPWSVRMARSEITRSPQAWMLDFSKDLKWNYCHGLICSAMLDIDTYYHTDIFYNYVKQYADTMILEDGNIIGYRTSNYNLSAINPGRILFKLYDKEQKEKYLSAIRHLRGQLHTHPRTKEGGLWHKSITTSQIWLDGIYMALPFYAEYAKRFNEPEIYDDIVLQIELAKKYLFDEKTGLYKQGWDESGQEQWADSTGKSPCIWGRSLGWFTMGIIDVLDFIPEDHPKRNFVLNIYKETIDAILNFQDEKTGVWYQITDKTSDKNNYKESSSSCMFTYAIFKGIRLGYLDESYRIPAEKAYKGILKSFIKENKNHLLTISECCEVGGLGGKPYRDGSYDYYINIPKRENDPKAVGSFILASLELEKLTLCHREKLPETITK